MRVEVPVDQYHVTAKVLLEVQFFSWALGLMFDYPLDTHDISYSSASRSIPGYAHADVFSYLQFLDVPHGRFSK